MSYYKRIERSREIRLWLTQIIFPVTLGSIVLYNSNTNFRNWVDTRYNNTKLKYSKLKNKFNKKDNIPDAEYESIKK